jgi:peptidoglycan/LPS O-acetylase OafA/YrhL
MTLESLSRSESARIPEVDGLRGIAILLVMVWHCIVAPSVSGPHTIASYNADFLGFTWSGVDLFFVISGFLIGGILLDHKTSTRYYRAFYVRRFFRIVPVYLVACIAFWILALVIPPRGYGYSLLFGNSPPPFTVLTFTQNFWMGLAGGFGALAFAPTWSLAVEEQFYLTLPLVIRSIDGRTLRKALLAVVLLAPVLRIALYLFVPHGWTWAFTAMPARADALAIGVLIAILVRDRNALASVISRRRALLFIPVGALSIILLFILWRLNYKDAAVVAIGYSALAILYGTILLWAITSPAALLARLLRASVLRWVGSVAYGAYLFHMVVLYGAFMIFRNGSAPVVKSGADVAISLLAIVVSLLLARISWVVFERRLTSMGRDYRYGRHAVATSTHEDGSTRVPVRS